MITFAKRRLEFSNRKWEIDPYWPDGNVPDRTEDIWRRRIVFPRLFAWDGCLSGNTKYPLSEWDKSWKVEELHERMRAEWMFRAQRLLDCGARIIEKRQDYIRDCPPSFLIVPHVKRTCDVSEVCPDCYSRRVNLALSMIGECGRGDEKCTLIYWRSHVELKPASFESDPSGELRAKRGELRRQMQRQIADRRDVYRRTGAVGAIALYHLLPRKNGFMVERNWVFKVPDQASMTCFRKLKGAIACASVTRTQALYFGTRALAYPTIMMRGEPNCVAMAMNATYGLRMMASFGCFRNEPHAQPPAYPIPRAPLRQPLHRDVKDAREQIITATA